MIRKKWEIPLLMVLLLALGAWLVWTGKNDIYGLHPAPGARTVEFRLGNSRGVVEVTSVPGSGVETIAGPPTQASLSCFRVLLRDGFEGPRMDASEFRLKYGPKALDAVLARSDNFLFRLLNITSWTNFIWASLGLAGQLAFFGRMLVQWIASEKKNQSVVPASFWWLSLWGGALLFTYFVWRQDFVGVLGQSTGVVIYARNLRLIAKHQDRLVDAG